MAHKHFNSLVLLFICMKIISINSNKANHFVIVEGTNICTTEDGWLVAPQHFTIVTKEFSTVVKNEYPRNGIGYTTPNSIVSAKIINPKQMTSEPLVAEFGMQIVWFPKSDWKIFDGNGNQILNA